MARYRSIHCLLWFDEKFTALSDDAKLVWFFCLTNPRGTMLGIAVQGQSDMAEFLGWSVKRFREPFRELLAKRLIEYHETTRTLYLPNFLKYNPIENENQAKSAAKLVDEIPENSPYLQTVKRFLEPLGKPFLKPLLERLAERYAQPGSVAVSSSSSSIQEQEGDPRVTALPSLGDLWNTICVSLPPVTRIGKSWGEKTRRRLQERSLDAWKTVFLKLEASAFCRGSNDRGWKATYDWIIDNETNADKVLQGKYDDRAPVVTEPKGFAVLRQLRAKEGKA